MKALPNWQGFLRNLVARLNGSRVELSSERATYLNTRAQMPDAKLSKPRFQPTRKGDVLRKTPESPYLQQLRAAAQDDLIGNRKILENTYRESTRFGATIDDDFAGPVG